MKNWRASPPPHKNFKKQELAKYAKVAGFIYQVGETEILRKITKQVPLKQIGSKEFQAKLDYVKTCLKNYREITGMGRGIAAPQVGIDSAFAVIYTADRLITIINPAITKQSDKLLKYPEMCMSAVPVIAPVTRAGWIEFTYRDEKGEKCRWDNKDDSQTNRMLNRVFQHEIDHLNGVVNLDLVKSPRELILNSDPEFYKTAGFEEIMDA